MLSIKILLLGITGDLARKKILPAIGEFAVRNNDKFTVSLIGYSRSQPDEVDVKNALNAAKKNGSDSLSSLKFLQGQYEDAAYYNTVISELKPNEQLIVYLAVPPQVFVPFLKNSCPFSAHPIDIVIEKPFGQTRAEAEQMIDIIRACDLHQRVHFFDHYLFKSAAFLDEVIMQKIKLFIAQKTAQKILVQAVENIGVKGRGGYYDQTGAIVDMVPHLYSLVRLAGDILDFSLVKPLEIQKVHTEQYPGYLTDIEVDDSKTETYFFASGVCENINVELESGKMQSQKLTQISVEYDDGTKILWQFAPKEKLVFIDKNTVSEIVIENGVELDHTRAFEMTVANNFGHFVTNEQVVEGWQAIESVLAAPEF